MNFERRLATRLQGEVNRQHPRPDAWNRILERAENGPTESLRFSLRQRVAAVAVGLAFATGGTLGVVRAFDGSRSSAASNRSGNVVEAAVDVVTTAQTAPYPRGIVATNDDAWVAVPESDPSLSDPCSGRVERVDAVEDHVDAQIPIDGIAEDVAAYADALWVLVRHYCPADSHYSSVVKIDPAHNEVVAAIALDDTIDAPAERLVASQGSLWVTRQKGPETGEVTRISAESESVTASISLPFAPGDIAVAAGIVWVAPQDPRPTIAFVDAATNRAKTIELPENVAGGKRLSLVGSADLWVLLANSRVVRIKPGDAHPFDITRQLPIDAVLVGADATGLWFVSSDVAANERALFHLDNATLAFSSVVAVTGNFVAASEAVNGSAIWLLMYEGGVQHVNLLSAGSRPPNS